MGVLSIDQLLKTAKDAYSIPPVVGQTYDKALKLGSWVVSGLHEYNQVKDELTKLKRYLSSTGTYGVQQAYYLANSILKENPISIPPHYTMGDVVNLKGIISKIMDGNLFDTSDVKQNKDYLKRLFDNEILFDTSKFGVESYNKITTPYSETKTVSNPKEVIKIINELGVSTGFSKWYGFELGSDHNWSISLRPYTGSTMTVKNPIGSSITAGEFESFTPELPKIKIPVLSDDGKMSIGEFDFGMNCPVLDYNLNFGNQKTKEIPYYNDSRMEFPTGFSYDMILMMSVLDDVNKSFHKYMNYYINSIYNVETNSLAPFHQAAFEIDLIIFKPGYNVNYMFRFIGVPNNYTPVLEGQSDPDEDRVTLQFSIIGLASGIGMTDPASADPNEVWLKKLKWRDVILNPNAAK